MRACLAGVVTLYYTLPPHAHHCMQRLERLATSSHSSVIHAAVPNETPISASTILLAPARASSSPVLSPSPLILRVVTHTPTADSAELSCPIRRPHTDPGEAPCFAYLIQTHAKVIRCPPSAGEAARRRPIRPRRVDLRIKWVWQSARAGIGHRVWSRHMPERFAHGTTIPSGFRTV
jgi:hypothetical protein